MVVLWVIFREQTWVTSRERRRAGRAPGLAGRRFESGAIIGFAMADTERVTRDAERAAD